VRRKTTGKINIMRGFAVLASIFIIAMTNASTVARHASPSSIVSVYTPLDLDKCKHRPGTEIEDYGSWRCSGYANIAVFVTAGDMRTYISYGPDAAEELAAKQTLEYFNSEGNVIEWRVERLANRKQHAFATILRWHVTKPDENSNPTIKGQVLVVTRLGPGGVCHVGYVDGRANPNANVLAQQIADKNAREFRCGKDAPIILGIRGEGFSTPYGTDD
jgi:hypothetical protein